MALRTGLCALSILSAAVGAGEAAACDSDATALFRCEAAGGRKFIELCAPSPLDATGFLAYRFGSLAKDGAEKAVELEYPADPDGSLKRFFAATYTYHGVYTQSVRFATATHGYRVYTEARGDAFLGAGVEVRDRRTGKSAIVQCSEVPRFYIFDLKGLVACDAETPVGVVCVK